MPFHNDVGLRVWEAGCHLSSYLVKNPRDVAGRRVLELGSGCGLTGLVCAGICQPREICLTDYTDETVENLKRNVKENLGWLKENGFDAVLGEVRGGERW